MSEEPKKDKIDVWLKEVAPSTEVRNAFEHVVLLYGAKDHRENQAAVLLDFLNGAGG